jgi:hypothetical protein
MLPAAGYTATHMDKTLESQTFTARMCRCGHQEAFHFFEHENRHPCEVCSCPDFTPTD